MSKINPNNKRMELLWELIKATKEGRVAWHPTARLGEFTCALQGHFGALVSKADAGEGRLRMLDTDDRELLSISDSEALRFGTDTYMAAIGEPLAGPPVSELFELARSRALHVDHAIDEVIQGLKGA